MPVDDKPADIRYPRFRGTAGDLCVYHQTITRNGVKTELDVRLVLAAFADGKARAETEYVVPIIKIQPIPTRSLPADTDLSPSALANLQFVPLVDPPPPTAVGKETLTVGKTRYVCTWVKMTQTVAPGGKRPITSVTKFWLSPDVPVTGLVKVESTETIPSRRETKTVLVLTEVGRKPDDR